MTILQIILLSGIFGAIFIILHFLFLYLLSLTKIAQTIFPFIASNLICFYLLKDFEIYKFFYDSLVINFAMFVIYVEFLLLLKKGFTLAIITSFKNKKKQSFSKIAKSYANGRGSKWILLDRLQEINKLKIIKLNKKIRLRKFGYFLAIILVLSRKVLSIKDFG